MEPLAATPRAEMWMRSRLLEALAPLRVYPDNHQGNERHVRYSWNGETSIHYVNGQRFVATTFLVYVVQPATNSGGRPYSWDLQADADKIDAALDFAPLAIQDGRRISGCQKDNGFYNPVWETDPVQLVEVQLGGYYRVYSSVEPEP